MGDLKVKYLDLPKQFKDEALWREIKKIFEGIKKILTKALKLHGSSIDLYLDASGKRGKYVPKLKVYGKEDARCLRCGTIIKRIKLGGRSAHFCPECQKP